MAKIRSIANRLTVLIVAVGLLPYCAWAVTDKLQICTACHGKDGMGQANPMIPVIAGMPVGHIEEAIYAYVDGARRCTRVPLMCETVATLSEDEVTEVAEFFSSVERTSPREPFDAGLAARGAELHERHCAACHLPPHDEDVAYAIGIPLHGQRPDYTRFAIESYFSGSRESLLDAMAYEISRLEAEDISALVNYYASYRADEHDPGGQAQ